MARIWDRTCSDMTICLVLNQVEGGGWERKIDKWEKWENWKQKCEGIKNRSWGKKKKEKICCFYRRLNCAAVAVVTL